ncbi:hypothetical protein BX666DRAFT_1857080 [Dichotomocladium elegans]|nr:hypothetical protein BX666DRAFT_1857080 [Dichotomocladium elegans]
MDTLYLNMIRFPNLIHAVSPPDRYLDQMRRRISNEEISMHAGYVDFQYGSFVPRWKAQTFLTQLGKSALGKERIRQAEHYFSLWTNQYPWIISAPVLQAARRMARALEEDLTEAPKDYFERFEDDPALDERDARSPCANDRCLFITNIDVMPHPSKLAFRRDEIAKTEDWEQKYDTLGELPTNDFFAAHGYQMAVDRDPTTCWNTFKNPRAGDYFGLILLGDVIPRKLQIDTPNMVNGAKNFFDVSVTNDGKNWVCAEHIRYWGGMTNEKGTDLSTRTRMHAPTDIM